MKGSGTGRRKKEVIWNDDDKEEAEKKLKQRKISTG